jgi:hypothetical protein
VTTHGGIAPVRMPDVQPFGAVARKISVLNRRNPSRPDDLLSGTILGGYVDAPDHAWVWCDTEVFSEDKPSGDGLKLAINALAGCVLVGSGRMGPFRDAADALGTYPSFDEAVFELPRAIRRATRVYGAMEIAARAPLRSQFIGLVGFSEKFGRIVAAEFELGSDFRAMVPCREFLSPTIGEPMDIADEQSVIAVAGQQLEELRRSLPAGTGGALIVAEIGRDGIRCRPAFDFRTGRVLRTGWRPYASER